MIGGAKIPLQASFPLSTRGEFLSQLLLRAREAGRSSLPEGFYGERALFPTLKPGH